jgi:1,4-dihydroxy-2-naphthoate octaprenyltransferase
MTSRVFASRDTRLLAPPRGGRLGSWAYALRTTNPPPGADPRALDPVTRWLVVLRAAVLPMTLIAALVAGLLAVRADGFSWPLHLLALGGLLVAHACNNLLDDLSDTDAGPDTAGSPRSLYAPHPILSGMVRRRSVGLTVLALMAVDLAVLVAIALQRGWPVVAFAVAGLLLSVGYAAPPLRLKARGLGELAVLLVWGPLMIAGTYFAAVGELPWQVWVASIPYGLLCTSVLMGKHVDKLSYDAATGTRTLPVILGDVPARGVTIGLLVAFYATTGLAVGLGALPWPVLVVALALPTLRSAAGALRKPAPAEPPPGFPVWPLWFAAVCFVHVRRAGGLLVLGLAVAAATTTGLPLGG